MEQYTVDRSKYGVYSNGCQQNVVLPYPLRELIRKLPRQLDGIDDHYLTHLGN